MFGSLKGAQVDADQNTTGPSKSLRPEPYAKIGHITHPIGKPIQGGPHFTGNQRGESNIDKGKGAEKEKKQAMDYD